ncbi:MAG: starch-binding protein, partial [Paludibacteraceae bacterium]|nr:starch-binding protein [Paludibacteraceae bacterium]
MTTNLLNNLSNVLKKGPSETQKNPLAFEAQSAAEKSNRVLITCLSRVNHLIQYRCMRYAALLFAVLVMSIGQAWGIDFTPAQIASGTTTSGISVSSSFSKSTGKKLCTSQTSEDAISLDQSAGATYNDKYLWITVPANCKITAVGVLTKSNGDSGVNGGVVYWSGAAATDGITSTATISAGARNTADCTTKVDLSVPANTRTVGIYRAPKIKNNAFNGSGTAVGGTSTFNVFALSVTATGTVTHNLTNVTKSSGNTTATLGSAYNASYKASDGYTLPSTITVTINGSAATAGTDYEWDSSTGDFTVPAAKVNGAIVITITGEAAAAGSGWGIASSDNSWTASADEMSGSGTVTKTLSLSANADLQFNIVDISGNTWYGNGEIWGGTKTQSVSSPGTANNCHLLTTEAGSYTFSFNTSTKDLTITYPNSYTFYYANTSSWSNVYVYKFTSNGSTGNNDAWPGTEIESPAYTCGGTDYYAATSDGYAKLIFTNNSGNQTGDMVVSSSNAGKYVAGTDNSWSNFPTYTVTYNKNGDGAGGAGSVTGSVPTDSNSPYACGSTVTVKGNTGSLARDGYNFIGWNT